MPDEARPVYGNPGEPAICLFCGKHLHRLPGSPQIWLGELHQGGFERFLDRVFAHDECVARHIHPDVLATARRGQPSQR